MKCVIIRSCCLLRMCVCLCVLWTLTCVWTQEFYPALRALLILLQPLAPHLSAHLWERLINATPKVPH